MTDWHHLFGMALTDLFTNTKYQVELEKDLSIQQQFLEVVIIEEAAGPPLTPMPDGLENLAKHNLLTYKSFQETLNQWALKELIGHYTTYRKLVSPDLNHLRPEAEFRLYAATTRYPVNLEKPLGLTKRQTGVYDVECCHPIRILVLGEFPQTPNNAFWQLFSAKEERVRYGGKYYQWKQSDLSSLLNQLFESYFMEGIVMSYTVEDYVKDTTKENLHTLSIEERLAGLSLREVLPRLPLEQVLQSWSLGHSLQWLSLEEILPCFSPEAIEVCLAKLTTQPAPFPEPASESQATCGTLEQKSTEVPQEQFEYFLMINWHRLFGMALIDLFTDSDYRLELGTYVSMQWQFLAMVTRTPTQGPPLTPILPEGLENLARYNLLTYKSPSEALDILALKELAVHYTRYRKQMTGDLEPLIAEEEFRLYAVSTHYPVNLGPLLTKCQDGVYETTLVHPIRVLVLSQLPKTPNHAFWHLFSANAENVWFGRTHYHWRQPTLSSLMNQLLERYHLESIVMPYTVVNEMRNYAKDHLQALTVEERLAGLSPDEVLPRFSPDQRLQRLSPDEIEAYLTKLKSQRSH